MINKKYFRKKNNEYGQIIGVIFNNNNNRFYVCIADV